MSPEGHDAEQNDDVQRLSDIFSRTGDRTDFEEIEERFTDFPRRKKEQRQLFRWIFFIVAMFLLIGGITCFIVLIFLDFASPCRSYDHIKIGIFGGTVLGEVISLSYIIAEYCFPVES